MAIGECKINGLMQPGSYSAQECKEMGGNPVEDAQKPAPTAAGTNAPAKPAAKTAPARPARSARPTTPTLNIGKVRGEAARFSKLTGIKIKISDNLSYEKGNPSTKIVNIPREVKIGFEKAKLEESAFRAVLTNIESALKNPESRYDLAKVKALLQKKGISLENLAKLSGKSGDDLIKAALELVKEDASQYLTETAKAESALLAAIADPRSTSQSIADLRAKLLKLIGENENIKKLYGESVKQSAAKINELNGKEAKAQAVKAAAGKALAAIANSNRPAELAAIYMANKGAIDSDRELQAALGNRALAIIKASEHELKDIEPIKAYLQFATDLKADESIITYNNTNEGKTFVAVVARGTDGKWSLASNVKAERKYYLGEDNGKPAMRSSIGFPDPWFETSVISTAAAAPQAPNGSAVIETAEQDIRIVSPDQNPKGDVDIENEGKRKKMEIWVRSNGNWVKIDNAANNYRFMLLLANGGDADRTESKTINRTKMADARAIIQAYARELKMSFADAARAYARSGSFRNVAFSELSSAGRELTTSLGGLLTAGDQKAFLDKKGFDPTIINLILKYVESNKKATEADIAAYMLRCAMASMTEMHDVFGVAKDALSGMKTYTPKTVTKENLVGWLNGMDVNDSVSDSTGSDAERAEAFRKLGAALAKSPQAGETYLKSKGSLKNDPDAIVEVAKRYEADGKFEDAIRLIKNISLGEMRKEKYGVIIKQRFQEFQLKLKDIRSLDKAEAEIKKLETLIKLMGDEAKDYLTYIYDSKFSLAMKYAENGREKEAMALVNTLPEDAAATYSEEGSKQVVKVKSRLEAVLEIAIICKNEAVIQEVIDNKNNKYNDLQRAMAYKAKAKLYFGWAESGRSGKPKVELYRDAFNFYYEARKLALKVEGQDRTKADEIASEASGTMSKIKDVLFGQNDIPMYIPKTTKAYKGWQAIKKDMDKKLNEIAAGDKSAAKKAAAGKGAGGGKGSKNPIIA